MLPGSSPAGLRIALVFVGLRAWQYVSASPAAIERLAGLDYRNYAEATRTRTGRRHLVPGSPAPRRGLYAVVPGDILYPPVRLLLFVPAAIAPWPLWWILPAAMVAWALFRLRPSPLAGPPWPRSWPGRRRPSTCSPATPASGSWARSRWQRCTVAGSLLLTKVTIAPLGLWGIRDRRWWRIALAALVAASLLFLPMWPTYVQVLLDAKHPAGIFYSAQDLPMLTIPLVAVATSTRRREDHADRSGGGAQGTGGTDPSWPPSTSAGRRAATCGA